MSCNRNFPKRTRELVTYGTTAQYAWFTDWVPVVGMTTVSVVVNLRDVSGAFGVRPAAQLCTVRPETPASPDPFTGSAVSSEDFHHFSETISPSGSAMIRFGVEFANSSGTAQGTGSVELDVSVLQCGRMVGSGTALIQPGECTGTGVNVVPITGWLPAVGVEKVMAAFAVLGNLNTGLDYRLTMRSALDPQRPNAWFPVETSYVTPAAGNSVRNTGEQLPPSGVDITNNQYFQLGIEYVNNGTANPGATITAMAGVRYA